MTSTQTVWTIQAGNKITGTYYGIVYTGLVMAVRPHTQNHEVLMLDVQLDLPITVFGMERNSMVVHASDDPQQLGRFQDANDHCAVLVGQIFKAMKSTLCSSDLRISATACPNFATDEDGMCDECRGEVGGDW